jgi:hypothetical protein
MIEKIRKGNALDMISHNEEKASEGDMPADERFHIDAINKEKISYKDTLEHLRHLKSTIEQAQQQVEKGRLKLQKDFDEWYRVMCENSRVATTSTSVEKYQEPTAPSATEQKESSQAKPIPPSATASHETREDKIQLPPGIKLTGNKEADDDIIAFFRAKQVLLSRSSIKL